MAKAKLDQDIRTRIDGFLSELADLVKEQALVSVRAALGDSGAAPGRRRGRPRGPGSPGSGARRGRPAQRGRRSTQDVDQLAETVLAHIRANPGQRLEEIGKSLGSPTQILK